MKLKQETQGYLFGILAAFFWGTHAVIIRHLTVSLDGIFIAISKLWVAIIVIFLILLCSKSKIDRTIKNKKQFLIVALLWMAANTVVFHIWLQYTTATNTMLLENTAPIFALLFLVIIFRKKVKINEVFSVLIAFLGIIIIVLRGKGIDFFQSAGFKGDMLEVAAGAFRAIFMIGSSKMLTQAKNTTERLSFLLKIFLVAAIILTPYLLFRSYAISIQDLAFILWLWIFPTAIAFRLRYEAAARIPPLAAIMLFNLSIVFTAINAHIFLWENISFSFIIGTLLILTGITLTKISENTQKNPISTQEEK